MKTATAQEAKAHIGRPPIFDDESKALRILKEESEHCRKLRKPCTLSSLSAEVASEFNVYLLKKSEERPKATPKGFKKVASEDAMKQALYKLVCKHDIWLSARVK